MGIVSPPAKLEELNMPVIRPIQAIQYTTESHADVSPLIAPPYDVLDELARRQLLETHRHNIVAIDLPHLPTKTVGPDAVYQQADRTYRQWLQEGVLVRQRDPAVFVYQQTYKAPSGDGKPLKRCGLMAAVAIQPFGRSPQQGRGAIYPHEQTFSGPKEDRMKLMCATRAQLSPIFGLYWDPDTHVHTLLRGVIDNGPATLYGQTDNDGVHHELWTVNDADQIAQFSHALAGLDVFIADGHHRYTTAMNYRQRLIDAGQLSATASDHPANFCLFMLVAMQDPGMIILPTHRVLGGMTGFTLEKLAHAAEGRLTITPFAGDDLAALEAALGRAGPHAMGLYDRAQSQPRLAIATTVEADPLAESHSHQSRAWRQLDVAILQHLIVEGICQRRFCPRDGQVTWKFPHSLAQLKADAEQDSFQLGMVMQPTPLESVRQVSEAGELMPQKSTFFYPKLATGLVIHPLEPLEGGFAPNA